MRSCIIISITIDWSILADVACATNPRYESLWLNASDAVLFQTLARREERAEMLVSNE